jgi:hypothetical protein
LQTVRIHEDSQPLHSPISAVCSASLYLSQERDFLPVLLALVRLARDKSEPNPEGGPPLVTEPKRIAGIGLVDAPVEAVTAAVRNLVIVERCAVPVALQ